MANEATADVGLIGLAVMGQNLVLNLHDHGYTVAVYNRTTSKVDEFLEDAAQETNVIGTHSLEEFIRSIKKPRKIILMIKAGSPVDATIESLLPLLEPGDIVIDGGNSLFTDTNRRCEWLDQKGILFVGAGISGGEEGARHGPSIMPGGNPKAWPHIKNMLQGIAAKVGDNQEPCCDWVGEKGAGHYVKMVHNGIEYGDMQLIGEAFNMMRHALHLSCEEMADIFQQWNQGDLNSYLIEITADILRYKENGTPLIEKILDVAGQKGTGKWTCIDALNLGMPLTLIAEAVFARCLSALKEERIEASKVLKGPKTKLTVDREYFIQSLAQALYASKIISYAQGFMLMRESTAEYQWTINYGSVALMWRGGCIIRSQFLGKIKEAYDRNSQLNNLLIDEFFCEQLSQTQDGWRHIVSTAANLGIPIPCMSTALAFYDGYRSAQLPANLLQAQRDYFGAHTYERTDQPRGKFFHTNWTGKGGDVSSSSYNV
ncbi:MAG: decarboxylating NADP(+)-dependent phosphogluconate dehydrogenase [Chlamydiales bacterium]